MPQVYLRCGRTAYFRFVNETDKTKSLLDQWGTGRCVKKIKRKCRKVRLVELQ